MRKTAIILAIILAIISSCRSGDPEADAWGNFEVTEITISSETGGRLLLVNAPEGRIVERGTIIAIADTSMLILQRNEILATISTIRTRVSALGSQNAITSQQIANLDINIDRTTKMVDDQAATQKQLDDLNGQKEVLKKQILANQAQANAVAAEIKVLESKLEQLNEQISRCTVRSPASGTIIARYAEEGEITAPGKPLAKIADLKTMKLKVYVSGAQLGMVVPGATCTVRTDEGQTGYRNYEGTITIVSPKAEFTPRIIQTKEERVNLVYAVTIEVTNDSFIRSGMPGEAIFSTSAK